MLQPAVKKDLRILEKSPESDLSSFVNKNSELNVPISNKEGKSFNDSSTNKSKNVANNYTAPVRQFTKKKPRSNLVEKSQEKLDLVPGPDNDLESSAVTPTMENRFRPDEIPSGGIKSREGGGLAMRKQTTQRASHIVASL